MRHENAAARADFLLHYSQDAEFRSAVADRLAQERFVNQAIAGREWLDWSTESAAMELLQANLAQTAITIGKQHEALVLSGPVVELLDPVFLFEQAMNAITVTGRLVGIIPCLRDNSPESQMFTALAALTLWPYRTAEELLEILSDAGWRVQEGVSRFIPIPQFNQAVLRDQLAFKGFHDIFNELEEQGYDPVEVGWGELQFVASALPS